MLVEAWAERDAERAEKAASSTSLRQNDRLRHLIRQLQRLQFGRRSEKLDPDQLNLALEDLEQAIAETEAEQEKADPALKRARAERRRAVRGSLPEHLPRVEVVIEPEDTACPCCGEAMQVIGEDRSSRLDVIPAQYQVVVTRRPKYACRKCQEGVVQAPAPARLIEGGLPTEQLVAHVLVAKYADHTPLYRQSPDSGAPGHRDRPLGAGLLGRLCRGRDQAAVAADARGAAALDQAVRRRDDGAGARSRTRPHQDGLLLGARPRRPAVAGRRAAGGGVQLRAGARRRTCDRRCSRAIPACCKPTPMPPTANSPIPSALGGPVTLAFCWAHWRRQWFDIARSPPAPIAAEALQRIAELYRIEAEIRGRSADERRAVRQQKTKPLIAALKTWLEKTLLQVPAAHRSPRPSAMASINGMGCCASSTTAASRSTPIPSSAACARLL